MKRKSVLLLRLLVMVVCILLCLLSLPGCQTYKDLDELLYVTSMIVDTNEAGDGVVLHIEAYKPKRTSQAHTESQERIVFTVTGDTISHAMLQLDSLTSSIVTYTHMKVFLITKCLALRGFSDYFDAFDRSQEITIRTKIAIFEGDPREYNKIELKEENNVGLYLFNLINNSKAISSYGVDVELKEFENQLHIGDRVNSIPLITIIDSESVNEMHHSNEDKAQKSSPPESGSNNNMGQQYITQLPPNSSENNSQNGESDQKLRIVGLSLVYQYQMIGELYDDSPMYFNLLLDNEVSGIIEVPHPTVPDKKCVLRILHYKLKTEGDYDGETYEAKRTLEVDTAFAESQADIDFNMEVSDVLIKEAEDKIAARCLELFEEYKKKGIDVFDIQEEFDRDYPKYEGKPIIKNTNLQVIAKVKIEGTTTTRSHLD